MTNSFSACTQADDCTQAVITRDYKGTPFQFREDGFFNMTKAAKYFGKRLDHFWENAYTVEYVEELRNVLTHRNPGKLIEATSGRYHGGTWAHPKLAVFFARWLDVKFAVWCDMIIDDLLRGKAEVTITKPEESAVLALPNDYASALRALADAVDQQEKLKADNLLLEQQKTVLQPKANTFDLVVAHKRISVSAFCRTFQGVNLMKVKKTLMKLGYLYRAGGRGNYRAYASSQRYFEERLNAEREGSWELYPTDAGKVLLAQLYNEGKLVMKKS